jgi:preprotein translocase subunit SecG
MSLFFIFLTILMFLDCIILVFLVLLQLPKKDAGAGMAFGGGATDALFGAGSGNVLTKITKWAAGAFFGIAILMAVLVSQQKKHTGVESLTEALGNSAVPAATNAASTANNSSVQQLPLISNLPPAQSAAPAAKPSTPAPGTNK